MPDAPFWVGKVTRFGELGFPPSMTEMKTSPAGAPDQVTAAGWLWMQYRSKIAEWRSA